MKFNISHQPSPRNNTNNTTDNQHSQITPGYKMRKTHLVVPYIQGLSESLKKVGGKHWVQAYFKGGQTIKGLLMVLKDKNFINKNVGCDTGSGVTGWIIMRNTWVNLQE